MTSPQAMPPARRRPIPGMSPTPAAAPPPAPIPDGDPLYAAEPAAAPANAAEPAPAPPATGATRRATPVRSRGAADERSTGAAGSAAEARRRRRPAADYAATRLVNFRLPVDLHDRYRQLVHGVERHHPRLRHPSLTELIIALLEEGPETVAEVAELIRRKRADEHSKEA